MPASGGPETYSSFLAAPLGLPAVLCSSCLVLCQAARFTVRSFSPRAAKTAASAWDFYGPPAGFCLSAGFLHHGVGQPVKMGLVIRQGETGKIPRGHIEIPVREVGQTNLVPIRRLPYRQLRGALAALTSKFVTPAGRIAVVFMSNTFRSSTSLVVSLSATHPRSHAGVPNSW